MAKAIDRASSLLDVEGVEGVAEGLHEGVPCILVFVSSTEACDQLPEEVDGYPIRVEWSGTIEAGG